MTDPIRPASDANLVTFRQWNRSMLNHPTLSVSTVVEAMDARIEADRAYIREQAEEIERLTKRLANCESSSEEIRATAKDAALSKPGETK